MPDTPAPVLLAEADFVIVDRDTVVPDASVLVRGNVIAAVAAGDDLRRAHPDATVVDVDGCIVHPGLVNAHNHLYQVLLRGLGKGYQLGDWLRNVTYPTARELKEADHYHAAQLAAADALRNGTTAIIDMPTHHARHHAGQAASALHDTGIRGAVARGMSDRVEIDAREGRTRAEELAAADDFLDEWRGRGLVDPWLGPSGFHSTSPELLTAPKELASARGTRLHVHLGETPDTLDRARAAGHEGDIAWARAIGLLDDQTLVAHAVWTQPTEHEPLAESGAVVVHNPTSNQLLAAGCAPVTTMRSHGVPVALGTDGPASNDSLDMYAEMKAAVLLQRMITFEPLAFGAGDAFELCTTGGAAALGIEKLGRLRHGYLADITTVRVRGNTRLTPIYNPIETLVFQGSGRDVVLTMVDGRMLYRAGALTSIDEERVLGEVAAIMARIAADHPCLLEPRANAVV